MKITNKIQEIRSISKIKLKDTIPAIIASVFSVLFSLSIVLELANMVDNYVLIFLAIFITLFLMFNENLKIRKVREVYKNVNKGASIPTMIFTLMISITLSCLGVYFWTNKTVEIKNESGIDKIEKITQLKTAHADKIAEIRSKKFDDTYYQNQIKYWQTRRAANVEERAVIRDRVEKAQNELFKALREHDLYISSMIASEEDKLASKALKIEAEYESDIDGMNRNNFISYIFFAMVLITEFIIISMNKLISQKEQALEKIANSEPGKEFIHTLNIIKELYLFKKKGSKINVNNIKYLSSAKRISSDEEIRWKRVKGIFNLFIIKEIFSKLSTSEEAKILVTEEEAIEMITKHYEVELSIT